MLWRMPRTLLAIGAHYDDCVFGIPGVLLQAVHRHDRVVILSLIGNYANWPPVAGRERALVDLTVQMARERGMEMRFLGWASMGFEPTLEAKRAVAAVVADVQPDVAFVLWPRDRHPDHEAASAICHAAINQPARLLGCDEVKTPGAVYWYDNGPGHTLGFEPDTYVDITAEWDPAREWLGRLMAFVLGAVWDPAKPDAATDLKSILARYRGAASGVATRRHSKGSADPARHDLNAAGSRPRLAGQWSRGHQ
jgi:N-acetylglucosamine malate deacetylase 1